MLRPWYIISSLVLIIYGTFCIVNGEMFLPTKRSGPITVHGFPMWFMYLAFISASANLISVFVDHYDRRDNEINYKKFASLTYRIGWFCFGMSMLLMFLFAFTGKVV